MYTPTRNTFNELHKEQPLFRIHVANLVENLEEEIDEQLPGINDAFNLDDDPVNNALVKDALLHQFACFLLHRPVPVREVIDYRFVNYDYAEKWALNTESPIGESNRPATTEIGTQLEVEQLKKQVSQLQAENDRLRLSKEALEQQAIDAMRYRKSKRNRRSFDCIDDYIQHEMRTAIREELQAIGLAYV